MQNGITVPGQGTFTVNPDGTVHFEPVSGFTGTVTVPYAIIDSEGLISAPANISITITPRAVPTANDDAASTPINTPIPAIDVLGNDSAVPPATLPASDSTVDLDPATPGGAFTVNPDGTVRFEPTPGFTGTVTVPYGVIDSQGVVSAPSSITVTVTARSTMPLTIPTLSNLGLLLLSLVLVAVVLVQRRL